MHRLERLVVYAALVVALLAAFGRTRPVGADGAADGTFGVVTATGLRIVAPDGRVLVQIGGDADGGTIAWNLASGKLAGGLSASANGGYATFRNADGKEAVFVGTATDAKLGVVSVSEAGGGRRAALFGTAAGAAHFYNADAKLVTYVGAASDTKAGLVFLLDGTGAKRAFEAGCGKSGGYRWTSNVDGKQSAYLGTVAETKAGLVQVNRPDGTRGGALSP